MKMSHRVFKVPALKTSSDGMAECTLLYSSNPADFHAAMTVADPALVERGLQAHPNLHESARAFAGAHRLTVVGQTERPGTIHLKGTPARMHRALTALEAAAKGESPPRAKAAAAIRELGPRVLAAVPRRFGVARASRRAIGVPTGTAGLFTAPMLSKGYDFPDGDGAGQRIAILLLAGGVSDQFLNVGCRTYFESLGLEPPKITIHPVGEARNDPADMADIEAYVLEIGGGHRGKPAARKGAPPRQPSHTAPAAAARKKVAHTDTILQRVKWTAEAIMDIELIGAIANGAAIAVYVCHDSAHDISAAINAAVDDGATVISCSFGAPEHTHNRHELIMIESALHHAAANHVTVCVSTGDSGSAADSTAPHRLEVSYPSSSPYVLAVGGTTLSLMKTSAGVGWNGEKVWKETLLGLQLATGGGLSAAFDLPDWQRDVTDAEQGAGGPKRAVPDVSCAAALSSGCWIWFGGKDDGVNSSAAGTSASVPIWAALVALLNQGLSMRLGRLAPYLYHPAVLARGFRDVKIGDNRVGSLKKYKGRTGWDACTGLGSPRGKALLKALQGVVHLAPSALPTGKRGVRAGHTPLPEGPTTPPA